VSPALIAYVLSLPLPVRLALLDADSTGPGWAIDRYGYGAHVHKDACGLLQGETTPSERLERGAAWLPCNPLAIAEHAARLERDGLTVHFVSASWGVEASLTKVAHYGRDTLLVVQDKCPHTAAVRLLAEVLRG